MDISDFYDGIKFKSSTGFRITSWLAASAASDTFGGTTGYCNSVSRGKTNYEIAFKKPAKRF